MSTQDPPAIPRATRSKRQPPLPLTSQPVQYSAWAPPMYTYPMYPPPHTIYPPTLSASITPEQGSHFTPEHGHFSLYPSALPTPYYPQQYIHYEHEEAPEVEPKAKKTPRPPNAWILYRSDMLKAIANGEEIPGLDAVMNESGLSASDDEPKEGKKKAKKPRKGAKEPSQGILSLGKGKTGRGLPQADISKMISLLWKKEKPEARAKYERMAEIKKLEHQERYPGYKFQPLRRAEKIKLKEEKEREKEAARREKDGKRRRQRTRPPASSPYKVDAETIWGEPKQNEMRSYPFPMPMAALPSIAAEPFPTYDIPCIVEPMYNEAPDAESLAAMWCLLEDETEAGPSDTRAWQVDADLASDQWDQFNVPPDFGNVELSAGVAEQIAAGWNQDLTSGFVTVGYDNPALPANQLSPIGDWLQPLDNRVSSGSSVSSEAKTPVASRYVSNSAYPVMESVGQDRVMSFSAFVVEEESTEREEPEIVPKPRARRGRVVGRSFSEES